MNCLLHHQALDAKLLKTDKSKANYDHGNHLGSNSVHTWTCNSFLFYFILMPPGRFRQILSSAGFLGSHVNTWFPLGSALIVIAIFLCIWGFLTVCGYGKCHFLVKRCG